MKRWICPICSRGKLAPAKPARDDARRYCLRCTERTGKLVERVSPAAQRAAAERGERRAAAAERERGRRSSQRLRERERVVAEAEVYPGILRVLMSRWERLATWGADIRGLSLAIRRRAQPYSTGRAYYREARIAVTAGTTEGDGYATLLHELAHHAGHRRPGPAQIDGHGSAFYRLLARAAEEVLGRPLDLPPGPADRRVNAVLAAAFDVEVAAGRLPAYGPDKPKPRLPRHRWIAGAPARIPLPACLVEEVKDVLECMRTEATDPEAEDDAVLAAAFDVEWCRDVLEEISWEFLPVHGSASGMWQRIARALHDRGEAADFPGIRGLACSIWRALGDPRGE
jgi:hypothetical protein